MYFKMFYRGHLNPESTLKPQDVADAIITKIKFETTLGEDVNYEVIETLIESIETCKTEMDKEFDNLDPKVDFLLRNFVRGKSTAYEEMLDILKKI